MPHVLVLMQDAPTPPVEVRVAAPSIDLSGIGQAIVNAFQGAMPQLATSAADAAVPAIQSTAPVLATSAGQSIATGGGGLVDTLGQNPLNVLTSTPPGLTYANPVVEYLQGVVLAAAVVALALIIAWAGLQVITRSTLGGLDFGEAFGRIVIGVAMLAGVRIGTGWALEAMNRLGVAILTAPLVGAGLPRMFVDLVDGGAGLVLTIIGLLAALWLYVVMWGRIVVLDVLLVFAPLAVVCWILPQTRGWFSTWVRLFFGWALVGPAVTLVLILGEAIGGSLGSGPPERLAGLLLSIAVFVFGALKVPSMVVSGWGQAVSGHTTMAAAGVASKAGAAAGAPVLASLRAAAHR